ncbi:MAG: hypothetical protein AB1726_09085, partial [Planctomycetota bacterium]
MPAADPLPARADEPLSVGAVLACARRRPGTIAGTIAAGTALAGLGLLMPRPAFESVATVRLEAPSLGGLGGLGRLMDLGASPATESEIAALLSRSLAAETVRGVPGVGVTTPATPGYDRHPGLTTIVEDDALALPALARRRLADPPLDGRPWIVPPGRLFAALAVEAEGAPRRIRVRFLAPDRVRLETRSLAILLHLADSHPAEARLVPGVPIAYRGTAVRLAAEGDLTGRVFDLEAQSAHEAIDRLLERLDVGETSRGSGVLRVSVRDSDPRRAQDALVALCNNYLDATSRRSRRRPEISIEYITGLLEDARAEFERAQAEILAVQAAAPEVLVVPAVAEELVTQISGLELERVRLETGERALAEITAALAQGDFSALALLDDAAAIGVVGSLGLGVDPLTSALVAQVSELVGERICAEEVFAPEHPEVARLRAQVDELVATLRRQIDARGANLRAERAVVAGRQEELRHSLAALPGQAASLAAPMLAVATYRELLPFLLQSLHAAEISTATAETPPELYDHASLPTELAAPAVARTLAGGAALGLLLGLAIAVRREPRRGRIRTWADVEAEIALPVLGTVPAHASRPGATAPVPAAVLSPPDSPAAEAFRHLRGRLAQPAPAEGRPVLLAAVGPGAGTGASSTNRGLAIAFARAGERTLLVDADLAAPAVHASFGIPAGPGLTAVLSGAAPLAAAALATDLPTLHVLGAGATDAVPGDLLTARALTELRRAAAGAYDRVVFDLPGALERPETSALAGTLDAVLLVARAGRTRRAALRAARAA